MTALLPVFLFLLTSFVSMHNPASQVPAIIAIRQYASPLTVVVVTAVADADADAIVIFWSC